VRVSIPKRFRVYKERRASSTNRGNSSKMPENVSRRCPVGNRGTFEKSAEIARRCPAFIEDARNLHLHIEHISNPLDATHIN
jgi:hypothetical protein